MTLEERILLCRAGYTAAQIADLDKPAPAPVPNPTPAPVRVENAPTPAHAPIPAHNPTPAPIPEPTPAPVPNPTPAATDNSSILSALADMQKAIVTAVQSANLAGAVIPPPTSDDISAIMNQIINPYNEGGNENV